MSHASDNGQSGPITIRFIGKECLVNFTVESGQHIKITSPGGGLAIRKVISLDETHFLLGDERIYTMEEFAEHMMDIGAKVEPFDPTTETGIVEQAKIDARRQVVLEAAAMIQKNMESSGYDVALHAPSADGQPARLFCQKEQGADEITINIFAARKDEDIDGPLFDERRCRVCGCTDNHACEGGCWWVEEDLCSACADPDEKAAQEEVAADHAAAEAEEQAGQDETAGYIHSARFRERLLANPPPMLDEDGNELLSRGRR